MTPNMAQVFSRAGAIKDLALSVVIVWGEPKRQIHVLKKPLARVAAVRSGMIHASAHLVKKSMIVRSMNDFPAYVNGPQTSM